MLYLTVVLIIALFLFINSLSPISGINEFTTNQNIDYQFNDQGVAQVEHQISIVNNFSQFYPKEYSFSLSGAKISDLQTFDNNGNIPTDMTQDDNNLKLSLKLTHPKIGKDQVTNLNIRYQSSTLAKKKGKTWEISLPQFQDSLNSNTSINLKIPQSFGKISSSPPGAIISTDSQSTNIKFTKFNPKDKFFLTFGEYQLFNFNLNFYLQNPLDQETMMTIPLPPDTANQKVFFEKIEPQPQKIENDPDGNWLAFYKLAPLSEINIIASGQAKIGQNPNYQFINNPVFNSQLYWPTDNLAIIDLAKTYTTPRQIYDYVVSTLNYDYNRINNPNRKGALEALKNPNSSLCTDFTDLFISVARAAHIGAREIEGYAYSNNIDIKPLSTGTDILHAWPEYYDSKTQKWIAIDPTWAKTTGGINYFDDLDLNHFTFVIHNQTSDLPPPPGSYKTDSTQKSIDITFAETEFFLPSKTPIITVDFNPFSPSFIIVKNPNLFSLDNFYINDHPPQNILPLSETKINYPQIPFWSSLLSKNQKIELILNHNDLPPQKIYIQNPYHFFNLLVTIISSLIILSFGAIILLQKK